MWLILARRLATKPFRKSLKILQHFEDNHQYFLTPEVIKFRNRLKTGLKSSEPTGKLDEMVCCQFRDLNTDGILSVLNTWESAKPNTLPSTIFYEAFAKLVRKGLWKSASWNQLIQITHFIGLMNGAADSKQLMILFLHDINASAVLSRAHFKDVSIISEAAFRTSTGISSPAIRSRVRDILTQQTQQLLEDSIWLVMLIKMMVFSKFHDVQLLEKLAENLTKSRELPRLPLTAKCYLMSLYAHAGFKHENLFRILITSVARSMSESDPRIKDVSNFLRAASNLNVKIDRGFLVNIVSPYLERQMTAKNLSDGLNIIIECCIAYWMLDTTPRSILDRILTPEKLQIIMEKEKNQRDLSRMQLLVGILEAESPGTLNDQQKAVRNQLKKFNIAKPSIAKECEKRQGLKQLISQLRECGFRDCRVDYPVTIYIAGISAKIMQKQVHIDILDAIVCFVSTSKPSGRLTAKVRLMKLKYPHIQHVYITQEMVERRLSKETFLELCGVSNIKRPISRS